MVIQLPGPLSPGWLGYTDDCKRMLIDLNFAAHHSTVILKTSVPIRVTEHDVRCAVRAMLVRGLEETAKIRLHAQHVEEIPAGFVQPGAGGILAGIQARGSGSPSGEILELLEA